MTRAGLGTAVRGAALCAALIALGCGDDSDGTGKAPAGGRKDAGADAGRDAGDPAEDAGKRPQDAGHDSGAPGDDDAGTVPPSCEPEACAASADECHVGTCNESTDTCEYTAKADGSHCGSDADTECTRPDRCMAGVCEPRHVAAGSACGDQGVDCKRDDACDGAGSCTDSGLEAPGSACGDATDTACDKPDTCDALGVCRPNYVAADTPCGDEDVLCHHVDTCNGAGVCQDGGLWNTSTVGNYSQCGSFGGTAIGGLPYCRCGDSSTINECSNVDVCVAGVCSGNHINEGQDCGTVGECEQERKCSAGTCTPTFKTNGSACGDPTNNAPCNLPDSCQDGVCQTNLAANGTACGDPTDSRECDGADRCLAGVCDPNHYGPIVCGAPVGECELPDRCDAGTCEPDAAMFVTAGASCGDTNSSECDDPDSCDGAGACDPNPKAPGTSCGDPTNTECDDPDSCDGAGSCQPNYALLDAPCGDYLTDTECDGADGCDGAGQCDAHYADAGTACGPAGTGCTLQDECDGAGQCEDLGMSTSCMGEITGQVVADDTGDPIQGASVSIHDSAVPAVETDENGAFTLLAPLYQPLIIRVTPPAGYWGSARYDSFTESDLDAGQFRLSSDAFIAGVLSTFPGTPTSDTTKAMLLASFSGASGAGGESLFVSGPAADSYTLDGATWVASEALVAGSTILAFVNMDTAAGSTTITAQGNGSNTCAVGGGLTTWPLLAHHLLSVEVACE